MTDDTHPSRPVDPRTAVDIVEMLEPERVERDWLMLGFLAMILAVSLLIAVTIIIAWQNGVRA